MHIYVVSTWIFIIGEKILDSPKFNIHKDEVLNIWIQNSPTVP